MLVNMGNNFYGVFAAITNYLLSGFKTTLSVAWVPLTDGMQDVFKDLPGIPEREIGATEQALHQTATELADGLASDFEKFKESKNLSPLESLTKIPKDAVSDAEKTSEKLGLKLGDNLAVGAKHGQDQLKSAVVGSASYFDTLYDYMSKLQEPLNSSGGYSRKKKAGEATKSVDPGAFGAAVAPSIMEASTQIYSGANSIGQVLGAASSGDDNAIPNFLAAIAGGIKTLVDQGKDSTGEVILQPAGL